jgi:hypothetical protein
MDTLVHADIFFFITTIAVVVVTLLAAVILFYAALTIRTLSKIVERIKTESDQVLEDLSDLRERVKENTSNMSGFGKWLLTLIVGKTAGAAFKGFSKKHPKSKTKSTGSEE